MGRLQIPGAVLPPGHDLSVALQPLDHMTDRTVGLLFDCQGDGDGVSPHPLPLPSLSHRPVPGEVRAGVTAGLGSLQETAGGAACTGPRRRALSFPRPDLGLPAVPPAGLWLLLSGEVEAVIPHPSVNDLSRGLSLIHCSSPVEGDVRGEDG